MKSQKELSSAECYEKLKPRLTQKLEKTNSERLNSITYELSDPYTLGRLAQPVLTPKCLGCQPMEFEVLELLAEDGLARCHTCGNTCQIEDLVSVKLFQEILDGDKENRYNQVIIYLLSKTYAYITNATVNSFPLFPRFEIALETARKYAMNSESRSIKMLISKEERKNGYIELLVAEEPDSRTTFLRGRNCEHASAMDFKYYYDELLGKNISECPFCSLRLEIVELELFKYGKLEKAEVAPSEKGKIRIPTKVFGITEQNNLEEIKKSIERLNEESRNIEQRQQDLSIFFYHATEIVKDKPTLPFKLRNEKMYLGSDTKFQEMLKSHINSSKFISE